MGEFEELIKALKESLEKTKESIEQQESINSNEENITEIKDAIQNLCKKYLNNGSNKKNVATAILWSLIDFSENYSSNSKSRQRFHSEAIHLLSRKLILEQQEDEDDDD